MCKGQIDMTLFSQRMGFRPKIKEIQSNSLDIETRARIQQNQPQTSPHLSPIGGKYWQSDVLQKFLPVITGYYNARALRVNRQKMQVTYICGLLCRRLV